MISDVGPESWFELRPKVIVEDDKRRPKVVVVEDDVLLRMRVRPAFGKAFKSLRRRLHIQPFFYSTGIPRMTPELARIFALLRPCSKTDARCGCLPAAREARTMVEGLIWLFSLASGRIPPVDCS